MPRKPPVEPVHKWNSPKQRAAVSAHMKKLNATMSPEKKAARTAKSLATRLANIAARKAMNAGNSGEQAAA